MRIIQHGHRSSVLPKVLNLDRVRRIGRTFYCTCDTFIVGTLPDEPVYQYARFAVCERNGLWVDADDGGNAFQHDMCENVNIRSSVTESLHAHDLRVYISLGDVVFHVGLKS
jgi:hypothetical protein